MQRVLRTALVATVAALGLAACSDDDNGNPTEAVPSALVRVVHASPDAPNVDIAVDGTVALVSVPYPVFSGYLEVPSGTRNVQVRPTGSLTPVIEADLDLETGVAYTVLATGLVADISPVVTVDDLVAPSEGNAKVRVIHGAPSAPNVDVYATAEGADLATATPILTNVPFRAVSDYLTVPTGRYQLSVTLTGTTTVATSAIVDFNSGQVRTVLAREAPGGGAPFTLVLLPDLN